MSEACKYQHDWPSKKQYNVKNVLLKEKKTLSHNYPICSSTEGGQF
jgi:hypothetical protein